MKYLPNLSSQQILILMFVFFIVACNENAIQKEKEIVSEPAKMDDVVQSKLKVILSTITEAKGKLDDSSTILSFASLKEFYKNNQYKVIWSSTENYLLFADSLYQFIEQSKLYGLFPEQYHLKQLKTIRNRFTADTLAQTDRRDAVLWTKADLLLTDAFLSMAKHIHKGRLMPDSIYNIIDSTQGLTFYHSYLKTFLQGKSITEVLNSLEPKHKGYQVLRKSIKPFLDSAKFIPAYTYVPYPYKDSIAFIKKLVRRLKEEGVVNWQVNQLDSILLKEALIKVQKQKKLAVDGKFGMQLVNALNNTDPEKFIRIAINLDRYKLMPSEMPERYIWVNLPSYYLQVMEHDTVQLESKVVIGKPKTRTPLLNSTISDLVTYPQWTIPNSIIVKEILPALKKNPGYLARKGYMLLSWDGETIDPYGVNWNKYNKGIPYKVVQGSGDANALGVLKFNFPNKYSVYLHDTNQRYLFKNEGRALSHGCVRVQEWEKLVWYISGLDSVAAEAKNTTFLPSDSIKTWLERKERHVIPVKSKLPVYFRYFTASVKNGKLFFYNDIYGEDKTAREAYFSNK